MDEIIKSYMQDIGVLRKSILPLEIIAPQIEFLEESIAELERIDGLCRAD